MSDFLYVAGSLENPAQSIILVRISLKIAAIESAFDGSM